MSVYKSLITDRLSVLSRIYEEYTGKKAFLCWIPPRRIAERGVYFFADGTIVVSADEAIQHMELLMRISPFSFREP